jgi:hypothetical protein
MVLPPNGVWCDGGPWDGLGITVAPGTYQTVIYGQRCENDQMVDIEFIYHCFGNIAVYDGWRYAE